jgi:hypothetical protein
LLDADVGQRHVNGFLGPIQKTHGNTGNGSDNRTRDGYEFEKAGDDPETNGGLDIEKEEDPRGKRADGDHRDELSEQPSAQHRCGGAQHLPCSGAGTMGEEVHQPFVVGAGIDGNEDGHEEDEDETTQGS